MKCSICSCTEKLTKRQYLRVLAFVLLGISVGTLVYTYGSTYRTSYEVRELENTTPAPQYLYASSSKPVRIEIPSINLSAPFEEPLGILEDGTVEPPTQYTTVGWYKYGPTPGEQGPAVILGHVDSVSGPAVFFSLGQVPLGGKVLITREDGSIVTFTITKLERIEQDAFPTERVYGNTPDAQIRLITCTGTYDKGIRRYSHNLIMYGTLDSVSNSEQE